MFVDETVARYKFLWEILYRYTQNCFTNLCKKIFVSLLPFILFFFQEGLSSHLHLSHFSLSSSFSFRKDWVLIFICLISPFHPLFLSGRTELSSLIVSFLPFILFFFQEGLSSHLYLSHFSLSSSFSFRKDWALIFICLISPFHPLFLSGRTELSSLFVSFLPFILFFFQEGLSSHLHFHKL